MLLSYQMHFALYKIYKMSLNLETNTLNRLIDKFISWLDARFMLSKFINMQQKNVYLIAINNALICPNENMSFKKTKFEY